MISLNVHDFQLEHHLIISVYEFAAQSMSFTCWRLPFWHAHAAKRYACIVICRDRQWMHQICYSEHVAGILVIPPAMNQTFVYIPSVRNLHILCRVRILCAYFPLSFYIFGNLIQRWMLSRTANNFLSNHFTTYGKKFLSTMVNA